MASAGWLVARVLHVRERTLPPAPMTSEQSGTHALAVLPPGSTTDDRTRRLVVIDAGMTELIRPALYGAEHAVGKKAQAALDELQTSSARKSFLDAQSADLEEAVATMEDAIRRIDRETRDGLGNELNRRLIQALTPFLADARADKRALLERVLRAEGVELSFTPDGVQKLAAIAFRANKTTQDIGARRLMTILEKCLEELRDALADLDRAIALDDQIAPAWLNRGNVLLDLGRHRHVLDDETGDLQPIFRRHRRVDKRQQGIAQFLVARRHVQHRHLGDGAQ